MLEDIKQPQIDTLFYSLFQDNSLRCAITITTDTLKQAHDRHQLDPMATIAMGRAFSCAALVGSTLKTDQHYINCTFEGDGPLSRVSAEFIAPSALRGFVAIPQLNQVLEAKDPIPETVGQALGPTGRLHIKKGDRTGENPYTGICEFESGEIAEDIAKYYLDSEQLPSIVGASVKLDEKGQVLASTGILIQKIAGTEIDETILKNLENKIANELNLSDRILAGESVEDIFHHFSGVTAKEAGYSKTPIGFKCFCSRERMAMTLMGLGQEELKNIHNEVGKIEIKCHYCSTMHTFKLDELKQH